VYKTDWSDKRRHAVTIGEEICKVAQPHRGPKAQNQTNLTNSDNKLLLLDRL